MAVDGQPVINVSDEHITSFIQASFVFKNEEGKAGQSGPTQLSITSNAFPDAAPVVLSAIRVEFEGSLRTIQLKHEPRDGQTSASSKVRVTKTTLAEAEINDDEDSDDSSSEAGSKLLLL